MLKRCLHYCVQSLSNFNIKKDYYKALNVPKTATKTDIKKSFLKLAKQYHPDANKGNQEKFKQINEAYQTLSNESEKKDYDQQRKEQENQSQSQNYSNKDEKNFNKNYQGSYQREYTNSYQKRQTGQSNNTYYGSSNYGKNFNHQNPFRYENRQNTYAGHNRNSREDPLRRMWQQQQQRYTEQSFGFSRQQQKQYDEMLRARSSSQNRYRSQQDIESIIRKHAEHIKITRDQVKRAEEEERRRRQKEYQQYRDITQQQFVKNIKEKAWKMAEGIKDNIEGASKVAQAMKQEAHILKQKAHKIKEKTENVLKKTKSFKNLWDSLTNNNRKNK